MRKYVRAQSECALARAVDRYSSLTYGYVARRKIRFSGVCGLSNFVPIARCQLAILARWIPVQARLESRDSRQSDDDTL